MPAQRISRCMVVCCRWQDAPYFMSNTLKEAIGASTKAFEEAEKPAEGNTATVAPVDTNAREYVALL